MSAKIKILIGALILITISSLLYAQISRSKTRKLIVESEALTGRVAKDAKVAYEANTRAREAAINAKKLAELAHEQAENAARQAEIMAAKMVQLQNKLEKCKKGK